MPESKTDFRTLIDEIESKEILLPDFQREFVWKDEDMQKQLVASVLTKMPCGSILFLKSQPDEYQSKKIGCKDPEDTSSIGKEIKFLLDGQQRVTVLANVFSSVIHDSTQVGRLISPALKRRFFLIIPKWKDAVSSENDLFGVKNFTFPYSDALKDIPSYLTGDILKYIVAVPFNANDDAPYNPKKTLSTQLDTFCIQQEKGYFIPLYLIIPTGDERKKEKIESRERTIIELIAKYISVEISDAVMGCTNDMEKHQLLDSIFDEDDIKEILPEQQLLPESQREILNTKLKEKISSWSTKMREYLDGCIRYMELSQIVVESSMRARSIDIYENLNKGGIALSTFDLVMARVAKVSTTNYYTRITKHICENKIYNADLLPDSTKKLFKKRIQTAHNARKYNAILNTGCYSEDKNEINKKFIDVFLDVLGLYINNKSLDAEGFKLDYMKRDAILNLEPKDINNNTECVLDAIDRALFFLQSRCGIRSITEVNYILIIVLLATVFLDSSKFQNSDIHDLLEAWYWSVLFSGEFDSDQNTKMISALTKLLKTMNKEMNSSWISSLNQNVFAMPNFSDKKLVLLQKYTDEGRLPKQIIKNFVCQYFLAKTYPDMFDSSKTISTFSEEADTLEAHHIIPLGSVTTYGESTNELRSKDSHICNSPINFVLITKASNLEISSKSLNEYLNVITDEAKSSLNLAMYTSVQNTDAKITDFLDKRFDWIKGDINNRIKNLLTAW